MIDSIILSQYNVKSKKLYHRQVLKNVKTSSAHAFLFLKVFICIFQI